jgi:tetratricopeptide (TPR) repeat protein
VPLPFGYAIHHVDEIEWYTGRIDGGKPEKVLDNIPVCANCHSFSKAGLIAMDIDYANDKGSYIIVPSKDTIRLSFDKIITWSDYKRDDGDATYGLLSQVSPNSKYVLSTVKDRSVFVPVDNLEYSQLFFPIKGILVYYDSEEKKFHELPGASDPAYVQSNPNWSPDSREVMFTRADRYTSSRIETSEGVILDLESVKEFVTREQDFKFDLYRIPFNDGRGGKAVPVPGASLNDKSNYFARYSPDGNWVVFCQAENYMLLQPDSKLYIMPADGGEPRLMNCNTGNMNSWHSWSPNGRWLVFSSKERGPYTQLYLTHIDKNGNDSPPVFLENLAFESRAANIPEFLPVNASVLNKMVDDFSNHAMYFTRLAGTSRYQKRYLDALKYVEAALETDSTYLDAYIERISIRLILGNTGSTDDLRDRKIAMELADRMIRQNPGDKSLYIKRGNLRLKETDFNGAFQDAAHVLKLNPNDYEGNQLMANIYEETGKFDMAIEYIRKLMKLNPNITHQTHLAVLYNKNNDPKRAIEIMDVLIKGDQDIADFYISRGNLMLNKKEYTSAGADFDRAVMAEPENYETCRARSKYYWIASMPEMEKRDQEQAIALISEDIRKNPQNAPLLLYRAEIMEEMGELQSAVREYENYMKTWPPVYTILTELGQYYVDQKQWQNAIASYTKIIDNFPERKKFLYDRSLVYEQTGDLQKALEDLNQVIAFYPKEYNCYYVRARINWEIMKVFPGIYEPRLPY